MFPAGKERGRGEKGRGEKGRGEKGRGEKGRGEKGRGEKGRGEKGRGEGVMFYRVWIVLQQLYFHKPDVMDFSYNYTFRTSQSGLYGVTYCHDNFMKVKMILL